MSFGSEWVSNNFCLVTGVQKQVLKIMVSLASLVFKSLYNDMSVMCTNIKLSKY